MSDKEKLFRPGKDIQGAWERENVPEKYLKVRQFLGNGRYAVRYVPENYPLRVDEEIVGMNRQRVR